jgi:hypothetical protein
MQNDDRGSPAARCEDLMCNTEGIQQIEGKWCFAYRGGKPADLIIDRQKGREMANE